MLTSYVKINFEARISYKYHLKIQFLPHRKCPVSPLEESTQLRLFREITAVYCENCSHGTEA
jgi:hypothetical protein